MAESSADGDSLSSIHAGERVEFLLFDSLVHHLIEKGVLTRNDALSVVQTAAQILRGRMLALPAAGGLSLDLDLLERTYTSFEGLPTRYARSPLDGSNVRPLRPPVHGDRPSFPSGDDA